MAPALPGFRYRATSRQNGREPIVENEICPVYLGRTTGHPEADPSETDDYVWVEWPEFRRRLTADPSAFSPWSRLQARQLEDTGALARYLTGQP